MMGTDIADEPGGSFTLDPEKLYDGTMPASTNLPVTQPHQGASALPHAPTAALPPNGPVNQNQSRAQATRPGTVDALPPDMEMRMARSRLGIVYGLYLALRAKHPPTAMHSLRVALSCSKWAEARQMPEHQRDMLEVASLLHDLGKLGIPDRVLQKNSQLVGDEQALMELHVQVGMELLRGAGASNEMLSIIGNYRRWYRMPGASESDQTELPLAAKMIAIVDAFDSMTSEQVFRRALSRERAVAELFECAGTQFDPHLVKEFATLITQPAPQLEALMVRRWLTDLKPNVTPGFWETEIAANSGAVQQMVDTLYHRQLLEAMNDAAVYVDCGGRILHWNRAAERMTGQNGSAVMHNIWTADIMGLRDENGKAIDSEHCPMKDVFNNRVHTARRLDVCHRDGRVFKVNLQALPVINNRREFCGAILLVRDASAQVSLEERVQTLHEKATRDPLTGCNNRAELDRRLAEFVPDRLGKNEPGSLIICDIDHFKRINDTYGHQAGDEALIVFAAVLREHARETDMVGRYGGEEFVVLCTDCDNATATARAEEIRRAVEHRSLPSLRGSSMTASFGVTEVQAGDTDESFLARADRALLLAKETGRNRVVQLGAGQTDAIDTSEQRGWLSWFRKRDASSSILQKEFLTPVPADVAVEKLSGFINDHKATILGIEADQAILQIDCRSSNQARRQADRPTHMIVRIKWQQVIVEGRHGVDQTKTWLQIGIGSNKARDRRMAALLEQSGQIMRSIVAYMGAQELDENTRRKIRSVDFGPKA